NAGDQQVGPTNLFQLLDLSKPVELGGDLRNHTHNVPVVQLGLHLIQPFLRPLQLATITGLEKKVEPTPKNLHLGDNANGDFIVDLRSLAMAAAFPARIRERISVSSRIMESPRSSADPVAGRSRRASPRQTDRLSKSRPTATISLSCSVGAASPGWPHGRIAIRSRSV